MRSYLERVLGGQYRIALAQDGADALEKARALRPDLILTDVMMPRMSGPDLLKAGREEEALRLTPVIFITARAGTEARIESLDAGADDYLAKPFDENELLARVTNLIRGRKQQQELAQLQKERMARFLPSHVADIIISADRPKDPKDSRYFENTASTDVNVATENAGAEANADAALNADLNATAENTEANAATNQ